MQLKDVMTRDIQDISTDSTLKNAAETMRALDVGALPVCENNKLAGMITDRDIAIRAVAEGRDPNRTSVRDAMSGPLIYCFEDEDVSKAIALMEEKQIRRLPVLDKNHRLCGIVSLGDLATRVRDDRISGEVLERVSEPSAAPQAQA
jgi:CBS domain-containing protein